MLKLISFVRISNDNDLVVLCEVQDGTVCRVVPETHTMVSVDAGRCSRERSLVTLNLIYVGEERVNPCDSKQEKD